MRKPLASLLMIVACASPPAGPSVTAPPSGGTPPPVTLQALRKGEAIAGFTAAARYVDFEDRPRGARFVHARTGFVFDYLQIESAPQAFVYAMTYPTSDRGEPHTQEHLLLGRGNKGRFLGNFEHTSLTRSSAFTAVYRTAYHFNTSAGTSAFWGVLRTELDTLLYPDYSDDEIRREVRDFGVTPGSGGALAIDEKGTVYNEMVRTFESPNERVWYQMRRMVYGPGHPLAFSNGGTPEGIRELGPEGIRQFHAAHYRLDNMGMVGAFPASVSLGDVLAHVGETLEAFAPKAPPPVPLVTEATLPARHGAPAGELRLVDYPFATADHPGDLMLAWPADRKLDVDERVLFELFLQAFAGGGGSNLYRALVDGKTRTLDVGATSVWAWVSREPGQAVCVGLENVSAASANLASLGAVRDVVRAELRKVMAIPDGSPELLDFGKRVKARAIETRRALDKLLDTPPEFGTRGTGDGWIDLLTDVQDQTDAFDKSLARRQALDRVLELADATANPWRERIAKWGLLEEPYGLAARPSPALRAQLDLDRAARAEAELTRLLGVYRTSDRAEALRRRHAEILEGDRAIAQAEATVPMPPLIANPPMTDDDLLAWRREERRGVPVVASTIETMKSATVGLALRLDRVPEELLPYLAVLPALVQDVGVVRGGAPIPYDEVRDRLRREILGLYVYYRTSFPLRRAELVFEASGNDVDETRRALGWMKDLLTSPDWRVANLPRIRDLVTQSATQLHDVMSQAEESWVDGVQEAYWRQDDPLLLHTGSVLTRAYDAHRLSWMLAGADAAFVHRLVGMSRPSPNASDRASLARLAKTLDAKDAKDASDARGRDLAVKAGRDLGQLLGDLPDSSLAKDWEQLVRQMASDAGRDPGATLEALKLTLASVRHADGARAWVVGSSRHQQAIQGDLDELFAALDPTPAPKPSYAAEAHVLARARAREAPRRKEAAREAPRYVALVNPNTGNGALSATAPLHPYDDPSEGALVDYLTANVFNGTGAHSFYKRVWGAGLAYSGYAWASPRYGRYGVYTDRCADLAQLVRFLGDVVRQTPADPRFVEYSIARGFSSRVADAYESRARGIASDLADGFPPERVRAFRERLLALRSRSGLAESIHARLVPTFAAVLPTLPAPPLVPPDVVHLAIGPEAQLKAYEQELQKARGAGVELLRLYPRDFWYVAPASGHEASRGGSPAK
jgi:Zn-dependent M16 (insulinase) family peptidase